MSMLKKGPELKMPELKVPDFALDLYYDLKERHLLPLVAILLVAVVALPILLSSGSSEAEPENRGRRRVDGRTAAQLETGRRQSGAGSARIPQAPCRRPQGPVRRKVRRIVGSERRRRIARCPQR